MCFFFTFNDNLLTASQFATLQSSRLLLSHNFLISLSQMNKLVPSANNKHDNKFEPLGNRTQVYLTDYHDSQYQMPLKDLRIFQV